MSYHCRSVEYPMLVRCSRGKSDVREASTKFTSQVRLSRGKPPGRFRHTISVHVGANSRSQPGIAHDRYVKLMPDLHPR